MDPSILNAASETEEDQHNEADRKVSAPIDPSALTLPIRRSGETRGSCFDLDMATIKALQEKADKAMGKVSQPDENDKNDESSDESDGDFEGDTDLSKTCSEEQENEGRTNGSDNSADQDSSTFPRRRANTVCRTTFGPPRESASRERKISQISINVGNTSQNDFKPVSFSFNADDIKRNERLISESATILNAQFKAKELEQDSTAIGRDPKDNLKDASLLSTPDNQTGNGGFKLETLTLQLDKSILNDGSTEPSDNNADELPMICVNDELYLSSPPPIELTLNNNIEKIDRERLVSTPPPSLQTTSAINIANVNKIPDGVQAITVELGNLNGLQFNSEQITCSVRRASTGSAPC